MEQDVFQKHRITGAEKAVADWLIRGMSSKEIANKLGLAEVTVKMHITSMMRKAKVKNRTQLVLLFVGFGFSALALLEAQNAAFQIEVRSLRRALAKANDELAGAMKAIGAMTSADARAATVEVDQRVLPRDRLPRIKLGHRA